MPLNFSSPGAPGSLDELDGVILNWNAKYRWDWWVAKQEAQLSKRDRATL